MSIEIIIREDDREERILHGRAALVVAYDEEKDLIKRYMSVCAKTTSGTTLHALLYGGALHMLESIGDTAYNRIAVGSMLTNSAKLIMSCGCDQDPNETSDAERAKEQA
ncbi:MAG: hypothetical protein HGA54_00905 [Actinobacteria bacterium]|nr:hypothetical protein [Actinomycetota bacterium]